MFTKLSPPGIEPACPQTSEMQSVAAAPAFYFLTICVNIFYLYNIDFITENQNSTECPVSQIIEAICEPSREQLAHTVISLGRNIPMNIPSLKLIKTP